MNEKLKKEKDIFKELDEKETQIRALQPQILPMQITVRADSVLIAEKKSSDGNDSHRSKLVLEEASDAINAIPSSDHIEDLEGLHKMCIVKPFNTLMEDGKK